MKLLNVAILCLFSFLTLNAFAEDAPPPPAAAESINAVDATPADNKEFNSDIDDFEKNMNKDVPPAKKTAAAATTPSSAPPAPIVKDRSAEKAHKSMKKQMASNTREVANKKKKKSAKKSSKKDKKSDKKSKKKKKKSKDY